MVKKIFITLYILMCGIVITAQNRVSNYNPQEAFSPDFYTYPGNEFRSASGQPGPKYWQNRADYKLAATLDTSAFTVSASEELLYTNNSPDSLNFLWLQVDQNIYRKDSRGTATIVGGRFGNDGLTDGDVIKSMAIEVNGKKYTPKFMITDTRMQVWLPDALPSNGGKLKLNIEFSFTVPKKGTDRMGRLNTKNGWIYEIAQWFPRMCVYDDLQGWNTLPYLGQGEFYLEYGDIDFSITVPSNIIVVGSGELLNPAECFSAEQAKRYAQAKNSDSTLIIYGKEDMRQLKKKGTTTWKYKITNTRDAAWAASNAFILDGARINMPSGKKVLALSAYPVESTAKPDGWQMSTAMVKGSLEFYSKTYYEYPYPTATNVAGDVAGMEYPGIVFCKYQESGQSLWMVTDHEFGHTWFPMIVGSNERRYAWMDEGFNTFINNFSTAAYQNGKYISKGFITRYATNPQTQFDDGIGRLLNTPDVTGQWDLAIAAYYKPAAMLDNLRDNILGAERFDAAFKEYIKRWAFKHPAPYDFFRTIENVAGEDLNWFWRSWVYNNWKLDQSVGNVKYVDSLHLEKGAVITIENLEKMPMPTTILVKEANGNEHRDKFPVEIWQRGYRYSYKVPTTSEIKQVIIDPDNKLPDFDRDNNTWPKKNK